MHEDARAPVRPDAPRPARGRARPWEGDWPEGEQWDPDLLREGTAATSSTATATGRSRPIVADLDTRRHDFHVAIENWQHDFNIGTIVRTANAFLAAEVHIVGNRRWNRRGAMVTDRYQHVRHHADAASLAAYLHGPDERPCACSASTTSPGSLHLETMELPRRVCFLFGQEGPACRESRARSATAPSRSPSSARPARSTPARRPRSRCTAGSGRTPTCGRTPGAGERTGAGCRKRRSQPSTARPGQTAPETGPLAAPGPEGALAVTTACGTPWSGRSRQARVACRKVAPSRHARGRSQSGRPAERPVPTGRRAAPRPGGAVGARVRASARAQDRATARWRAVAGDEAARRSGDGER